MALTLLVSPEPLADRPRVRLDVTGTNVIPNPVGPNALVSLYRTHSDGRRYRVILEADARLSAGVGVWYDYHSPFDQQVSYSVVIGTVEQSGLEASGYWNYAPPPNLLPSQIAGLGKSGSPAENGWLAVLGTVAQAGSGIHIYPNPGNSSLTISAPIYLTTPIAGGDPYTAQVKVTNSLETAYEPSISVVVFNDQGVQLGGIDLADAIEYGPGDVQTFQASGVMPLGGAYLVLSISAGFGIAGGSCVIDNFMIEAGNTPSAFPAPEWIPLELSETILASDSTWLISPTSPSLSCAVHAVKDLSSRSQPTQSGLLQVIGRRNPVAINAGRRAGQRGTIIVRSDSEDMDTAIAAVLDPDGPILVNPQGGFERDMPWLWVQPGDIELRNPGEYTGYPYRHIAIPYTEIDQPEVYSSSLWTCADVVTEWATCADVLAAYATAIDLQTDTRL